MGPLVAPSDLGGHGRPWRAPWRRVVTVSPSTSEQRRAASTVVAGLAGEPVDLDDVADGDLLLAATSADDRVHRGLAHSLTFSGPLDGPRTAHARTTARAGCTSRCGHRGSRVRTGTPPGQTARPSPTLTAVATGHVGRPAAGGRRLGRAGLPARGLAAALGGPRVAAGWVGLDRVLDRRPRRRRRSRRSRRGGRAASRSLGGRAWPSRSAAASRGRARGARPRASRGSASTRRCPPARPAAGARRRCACGCDRRCRSDSPPPVFAPTGSVVDDGRRGRCSARRSR